MKRFSEYLSRIGFTGVLSLNVETLQSIVFAHATTIPFECLDPIAGISVSLEIEAIEDKLVRRQRGGYCFEQNALLAAALREVGFAVDELSARVWYNTQNGSVPPRTHVFLAVTLDGTRWLADCGVGGSTPTDLMRLDLIDEPQALLGESRRIVAVTGRLVPTFMHQVFYGKHWADVYEFTGEAMPKIDQEMGNWWTSQHPDSKFRKNLIVAKLNRDGSRYSIVNNEATYRRSENVVERIVIRSRNQLCELLHDRFKLELPESANVNHLF